MNPAGQIPSEATEVYSRGTVFVIERGVKSGMKFEAPYRLTNRRGRVFRLFRTEKQPNLMFTVPEVGFSASSIAKHWFREVNGALMPVDVVGVR